MLSAESPRDIIAYIYQQCEAKDTKDSRGRLQNCQGKTVSLIFIYYVFWKFLSETSLSLSFLQQWRYVQASQITMILYSMMRYNISAIALNLINGLVTHQKIEKSHSTCVALKDVKLWLVKRQNQYEPSRARTWKLFTLAVWQLAITLAHVNMFVYYNKQKYITNAHNPHTNYIFFLVYLYIRFPGFATYWRGSKLTNHERRIQGRIYHFNFRSS